MDTIRSRRKFSPQSQQGAIMLTCHVQDIELDGVDVYYAKNPKHFWLGKADPPHVTLHHGFELSRYEEDGSGEAGFRADIESILDALDKDDDQKEPSFKQRLYSSKLNVEPSFFPPNPALLSSGEDNYFTIVLKVEPSPEMVRFRQALLQVFPHVSQFPTWSTHASMVTVATLESKDLMLERLKHTSLTLGELYIGYNIIQKYSKGPDGK